MSSSPAKPLLARYVAGVAFTGMASVGALVVVQRLRFPLEASGAALMLLALVSAWVPVRFHHRGGVQGFNLLGAVFIGLLFTVPSALPAVVVVLSSLLAFSLRRLSPLKVVYNAGQDAVWAAVGTATFYALGAPIDPLTATGLIAAIATGAAMVVANALLMAGLFHCLDGRSLVAVIKDVRWLHLATFLGNTTAGFVLAILAMQSPWAVLPGGVFLVGLHLGYRGYAGVLEERQRAERLHAVTRSLADATASRDAMGTFLTQLRALFGAGAADLMIVDQSGHRRVTLRGDEVVVHEDAADDDGPLGEALRRRAAVHVVAGDGALAEVLESRGHRDALSAPLFSEGRCVGALAVYDRHGLEPWDDTDATLLATLANEAAVALKNVELFRQVEEERARLAAESRKLSDIVNAASDGISMVDQDGTIAAWNPGMEQISGLGAGFAIGQPWFVVLRLRDRDHNEILPDGDSPLHRGLAGELLSEPVDLQVMRRDGQWRWIRASISPVNRGEDRPAVVLVARDVTSEREVEGLKADFVATVSHELRTPLTPIKGFLMTLQNRRAELDDGQVGGLLAAMGSQIDRLEALVGDLLIVADIDRGGIALEHELVDLVSCTELALAQQPDPDGRARLGACEDVRVIGDNSALSRTVSALISNALKHTDGAVEVSVVAERDQAVVRVADEGPGIAAWEQQRIFERFHRLGDHLTRTQGPGLGLPIARALARRLGGDVTVTSDVGQGSVFELRLPAAGPRAVLPNERRMARRITG